MAADVVQVWDSCMECLSWGVIAYGVCEACGKWAVQHPVRGVCPRCRRQGYLNTDGLCRGCVRAIRLDGDIDWVFTSQLARPRAVQLIFDLALGPAGAARPLHYPSAAPATRSRWQRRILAADSSATDSHRAVLPPTARGQVALFPASRTLTVATAVAVANRVLDGEELAQAQIRGFAAEHGLGRAWKFKARRMIRLALAVRDAEGSPLVLDSVLADLPEIGTAVGLILKRAALLDGDPAVARAACGTPPRAVYLPRPRTPSWPAPRSCRECDGWMSGIREHLCRACSTWRSEPRGRCTGCGRQQTPLRQGQCRLCAATPSAVAGGHQLMVVIPAAARGRPLPARAGTEALGLVPVVAASVVPCGQQVLFRIRRDWTSVITRVRNRQTLPELSERASTLVQEFDSLRRQRRGPGLGRESQRTLVLLLRFLGAEAPVWEHDVHDLARAGSGLHAARVCEFLFARGLLVEAPELHADPDKAWIEAVLSGLPAQLAVEVGVWVTVLRGQGRWSRPPRSFRCIRRYLAALQPALASWHEGGTTSLRGVTEQDIVAVARNLTGGQDPQLATALRSLFRALKQERVIFQDPARTLTGRGHTGLPRSVPSDLLPTLFEEVTSAFGRLTVALVAVHALTGESIRALQLTDLDLAHGRLTGRQGLRRRTIHLEPFTYQLAADWLTERHRRWPASTNPHLLTTGRAALAAAAPPVHITTIRCVFPKGMNLNALRQDRILDEALTSTDPLHLMRIFGISEATAMRYITAAHPERTAKLPR
ncbi:hypothetical protein [Streptomyces melanogenes]|uniref:hypothetical protein n=1 Tax=Streptomyces melanogenes TaxID=67326 RepID=UPI00378CD26D